MEPGGEPDSDLGPAVRGEKAVVEKKIFVRFVPHLPPVPLACIRHKCFLEGVTILPHTYSFSFDFSTK